MYLAVRTLCVLLCSLPLFAADLSLPGCDANPEIRKTIAAKLTGDAFDSLPFEQQKKLRRQVLEDLAARYPRELEPQRQLIRYSYFEDQPFYLELMSRYRQLAEAHPNDPLILYFAGQVLGSPDPDQSLKYLNRAKQIAPGFPWPDLEMSFTYTSGRTLDKKRATEVIDRFFTICPTSDDRSAQFSLSRAGSPETQKRVALALRKSLQTETDPRRLLAYESVWGLEFRNHPVPEHDAIRKQIALDVARLESIAARQSKPDVPLLTLIRDGDKQSGAAPAVVTAAEDRIVDSSHGYEAASILDDRWSKTHPQPGDPNDKAAWEKYNTESLAHQRDMIHRFPANPEMAHETLFYELSRQISPDRRELLAAFDDHLHYETVFQEPDSNIYLRAADFLLEQRTQPQRALEYAQKARQLSAQEHVLEDQINRNTTEHQLKNRADDRLDQQQEITGDILRAALQSNLRAVDVPSIPSTPPDDAKLQSAYWANRARQAALDNHSTDALAFYQKALFVRTSPPSVYRGRKSDPLGDEAAAYWKQNGGTDTTYALWSTPPISKGTELAQGIWEKPSKTMPSFELTDLSGKSWSLQHLEGKTVLINVWATWCGFCVQELPKLEKLYEQVKDRPDIQILTFNIDEDAGLAAPFVKEHGYTFPVLLAYGTVNQILDSVAIPQNWIVSRAGKWQWTQMGYDSSNANWQAEMLNKLKPE